MSQPKTVLLLNGSPKCEKSNSRAIGKFLTEKLEEKGFKSEEAFATRLTRTPEGCENLLRSVDDADIMIFATPLYVDSVPAFTIKAMETINEHRKSQRQNKPQTLVAVMNCGFPEKEHMEIALKIIKNFAAETGFRWSGAATVGMGNALNGEPLQEGNGMTRHLTRGLALAAVALAEGQPIPAKAEDLASKPFMPIFLSRAMLQVFGKRMWNKAAKENHVKGGMYARPYELQQKP